MLVTQISIELSGTNRQEYVVAKQGDDETRVIQVRLLTDGRIYVIDDQTTARVSITKPDGTEVIQNCIVKNNMIEIVLDKNMLAVPGLAVTEILLTDLSGTVTSASFDIKVVATKTGKNAESSNDYQSFKGALAEVQNERKNIEGLMQEFSELENGGIYIGSGDMPEGYRVQIDPEEEENTLELGVTYDDGTTETFILYGEVL